MGASLEIGKLVTASWLHKNWKSAPLVLKTYLSIAVIILMIITSLGIFGFLSRAHIEQGAPIGDVSAQIELIDEKIAAKRTEIEQSRTALKNLDDVVAQFLAKGKDERSVAAANNARRNQQAERNKTSKIIDDAQKEISKLQQEKLPLTQQVRKIETEVGPIKYIAAFIYGTTPGQDLLEKAVTWMILSIIFVFDPLAVLLLIASQISFANAAEQRRNKKKTVEEQTLPDPRPVPEPQPVADLIAKEPWSETVITPTALVTEPIITTITVVEAKPKEKEDVINSERTDQDNGRSDVTDNVNINKDVVVTDEQPVQDANDVPPVLVKKKEPKKKESYMMKKDNQQITVTKK